MDLYNITKEIVLTDSVETKRISISDSFIKIQLWDLAEIKVMAKDSIVYLQMFGMSKCNISMVGNSTLHVEQSGRSQTNISMYDDSVANLSIAGNANAELNSYDNSVTKGLVSGNAELKKVNISLLTIIKIKTGNNGTISN